MPKPEAPLKVIFLDIDGVLNNQLMFETREAIIKTPGGNLSRTCVAAFNKLIADTGAKIVLSSTWRTDTDIEDYLKEAGLEGEIIGKTPVLRDCFTLRGNEIHAWIVENKEYLGAEYYDYHSFVILDDDSDMLLWHRENFFHTDNYCGLTPTIAYRAARFLNRHPATQTPTT